MLLLLFTAARCERTLQMTQRQEHSAGAWVSLHAGAIRQGWGVGLLGISMVIKDIEEPETAP